MKIENFFLAAVCCVLLGGCGQKSNIAEGVVTVNFHDNVEKPLSEMPDAFYSDKRYVALHADDQELMIGEIGKVVLHGDRIYANEWAIGPNARHVLVAHDATGRAVAKIGNQGRGPGEYLQISDFDVDAEGRIHIADATYAVRKIFIYGPDGRFIEEKLFPFSIDRIHCTPDGGYLIILATWEESEGLAGRQFVKTDARMNILSVAGEWDMSQIDNNFVLGNGSFVSTPEGSFALRSPDETLYRLDEDGNIAATWFLDLGRYGIPPENRGNLEALYDAGKLYSFRAFRDFVAPWGRYIFGTMRDRGDRKSFVYDTKTEINYTQLNDSSDTFGNFMDISDGLLIANFPAFDGETLPDGVPEDLRYGVVAGDPLICLYELK